MSDDKTDLKRVVARALSVPPFALDPTFFFLQNAEIGDPIPLFNPEGFQDSWIIPFLLEGMVCGIAQVSLNNSLIRTSVFGSDPNQKKNWFNPSFLEKPPKKYIKEIRERYQNYRFSDPLLTFDNSLTRWGWRIQIFDNESIISEIFINFNGWYSKAVTNKKKDY
jgi:hypothetical protein